MEPSSTMTIRLPETIKNRLENLAQATDRSKAYLATKAIEEFVATQEWQIQAIQAAVKKADSPQARFIEHDVVVNKLKRKMAQRKGNKL